MTGSRVVSPGTLTRVRPPRDAASPASRLGRHHGHDFVTSRHEALCKPNIDSRTRTHRWHRLTGPLGESAGDDSPAESCQHSMPSRRGLPRLKSQESRVKSRHRLRSLRTSSTSSARDALFLVVLVPHVFLAPIRPHTRIHMGAQVLCTTTASKTTATMRRAVLRRAARRKLERLRSARNLMTARARRVRAQRSSREACRLPPPAHPLAAPLAR